MPIELWAARLERPLTAEEDAAMLALLPPERRERLERLRQPEKRREPLCAYLILCRALWEQYRWRALPPIRTTSLGKPYFPDHPDVHFNLSHTAGAVLVALSDRPVGVDIERIRPVSPRTMRRLADVQTERAFFESWVRREARSKRSGAGVGTMLTAEEPLQRGEQFYELDTFPGYAAGVSTRGGGPPSPLRRYTLDEIT
ncbi:4'-phosphopantetheinyl transferase family protein [Dysosmobacter sp.]|uniref:4'-phosphopantetheinyl transferase family protein n=1 Tax=Dysosmobacter sp. TaxID=2591382 RepID=UPI003AB68A91